MTRLSFLLLGSACALACAGARADDDTISPDRPDFVNSSQVVGKGRIQLELGPQWARQRDPDLHTRTLTTPLTLRYGIGDDLELRLDTDGRSIEHAVDPASGVHATTAGYADSAIGFKWHLAEQQGAVPAYGVIAHALLPSGSSALRGQGLRPAVYLAAEWDLPRDFSLGIMPGLASDSKDSGAHYGYGVFGASLGKNFGPRLSGFLEVALPQIARADNGGTQASVDTGLGWLVDKDCQLDVVLTHGLNRRTPDLGLGFGISLRR